MRLPVCRSRVTHLHRRHVRQRVGGGRLELTLDCPGQVIVVHRPGDRLDLLAFVREEHTLQQADDPSVGLSEGTARQHGSRFRIKGERTSKWYSSRRVETCSEYKALVEEDQDRILGGHILGGGAKEVISLFALAIRSGIPARDLKHTLSAYPSHSSDVAYML